MSLSLCLVLGVLAGCAAAPQPVEGPPTAILVQAPEQVTLGQTARIEWEVEGTPRGDPYRTGVHFGPASTRHMNAGSLDIDDFPRSSTHRMGDGPGRYAADLLPLEAGRIHYRLHVERHNEYAWSRELVLDVAEPTHPVLLPDADRTTPHAWSGREATVWWRFHAPDASGVASLEAVAGYPEGPVVVGRNDTPPPGPLAVAARFPAPAQQVPVHGRAVLHDGRVIESRPLDLQVVGAGGSLGELVAGDLASPAGRFFPLTWRLLGAQEPDHHDLHVGMHATGADLADPLSLHDRVAPNWDGDLAMHWAALNITAPGFMVGRIHTVVDGVETWSRTYVVEVYPPGD